MPQAEEGNRVRVNYICRMEDGTILDESTGSSPLTFIIGEERVPLVLEKAVIGMEPGEVKRMRVPAVELETFPFRQDPAPVGEGFAAGVAAGDQEEYDVGPEEEAEPRQELPTERLRVETITGEWPEPPKGEDVLVELELLAIDEGELQLGEV